jgi:Family of unknown function (DUF6152)
MKSSRSMFAAVVWGLSVAAGVGVAPVSAHHSFALYDMNKSADVEGTVVRMEWSNPHCWLFIDSASADGATVSYGFEMTSVGEMIRRGWAKNSLKPGDRIKIKFHPVRDGKPAGYMMSVMTSDGRYVGRAPEGQGGPPAAESKE